MTPHTPPVDYREVLPDDESLALFLRNLAKFDRDFCTMIADGVDFTLKLEVHGNKGELIHCCVNSQRFERPRGVEKKIEDKHRRGKVKIAG